MVQQDREKLTLMESQFDEYTVRNETFRFYRHKTIQNTEDAYFMGYMACDGGFEKDKRMTLTSTSKYIVDELAERYCPDNLVRDRGKRSSALVNSTNNTYELAMSAKLNTLFKTYGVFNYKRDRRVFGISNKYFLAYLAGVIDADGWISVTHRRDQRTPNLTFGIAHEGKQYLLDLQRILADTFNHATYMQEYSGHWKLKSEGKFRNAKLLHFVVRFMKNKQKIEKINDYLQSYCALQESGELLEPKPGISSQAEGTPSEGSETSGEVETS